MHLPHLVTDLALILLVAGLASILCRWLQQPVVLGYILAGTLVGPHVPLLPTVIDTETVKAWAELGVIFFLFHLGIEFSFRKLMKVGFSVLTTAVVEVLAMLGIGFLAGRAFGWNFTNSIFLGAILSISSTTIIIKAFEEYSLKTRAFATMVYGVLIVEDLLAVLLLVILSTIGASKSFQGTELLSHLAVLGLFLCIAIPLGLFVFPRLLRHARPYLNDEARVVLSLGACLGLVVCSAKAGLSSALGAFLMGAFFAETVENDRVERFLQPIKQLFGAVFFTSVGMLVDVRVLANHWQLVLLISTITIFGKAATTTLGMLLARQERSLAFQTGLSLAQIGEFSFIIATLGLSLGVIREDLYPITVAVSLVTTFTTPYLIRLAGSSFVSRLKANSNPVRMEKGAGSIGKRFWDGHVVEMEVHPHFVYLGETLENLQLRERFGITIISIIRGERQIVAPVRQERLMAHDRVVVLGTDRQLQEFEGFLRAERIDLKDGEEFPYDFRRVELTPTSSLIGKTLRDSGVREAIDGLILGIERDSQKVLNPLSTETLLQGDILWLYGRREKLRELA